jgi:hypothetical protein
VSYIWIGIGANDFSPYYTESYKDIYNGTMSDAQLKEKIDKAISNVTLAVNTVRDAGAKGIIVTYFTQWELDPLISQRYPDPARRKRAADAIEAVNQGIQALANGRNVYVFNQNNVGMKLLPALRDKRYLLVGNQKIDFLECGDAPQFSRLADKQHLGTVMSGITANLYFVATLNEKFGLHIQTLSDQEILRIAGFKE